MGVWQELSLEIRLLLTAAAWICGAWFVGATVAAIVVSRLHKGGWGRALDWRWLDAPTTPDRTHVEVPAPAAPSDVSEPATAAPPSTLPDEDDEETELAPPLQTIKTLLVVSVVAIGTRQAALLWRYSPVLEWVDRLLPLAWMIAAAAAGALLAGNKILRPLLPIVFSENVRDRLDRFYPVPKGEQSFSTATRMLTGWCVYAICGLVWTTLIADLGGWTTTRGVLATVWRSLLSVTTIGLIWYVAMRVLHGMDEMSKEHPDDSLAAGARATGRRTLVFGVAGLVTCLALFESAMWFVGPVLLVGAGVLAWVLRHYVEDYAAGIHLRLTEVQTVRLVGVPVRIVEVRSFASRVVDDTGTERLLPNARLVEAFRVENSAVKGSRERSETTPRSTYVPPEPTVPPGVPPSLPVDDSPHPFGAAPAVPFDPEHEYALPGATAATACTPPDAPPPDAPPPLTPPPPAASSP